MEATIKLKDAVEILKQRYKREYNSDNLTLELSINEWKRYYKDWDGSSDYTTEREIHGKISYDIKFGSYVARNSIDKSKDELAKDLREELATMYKDDEHEVLSVGFPFYNSSKIDLMKDVYIRFKNKKNDKVLVKK